jgi:hypothetical protein
MSQMPSLEYQKKYPEKYGLPQDKKSEQGAPLPNDPKNPVSEVEGLFGIRMTKAQKWAWVIGLTAVLWGVTYYTSKKR